MSCTHSGTNTILCTLCITVFYPTPSPTHCPTHCPTHSQMFDFQSSDFIVLVHTNRLGYHQNGLFEKHSSVDFLREVLSTLGLQGMERGGEVQERRGEEGEGQLSSAQSEALVPN